MANVEFQPLNEDNTEANKLTDELVLLMLGRLRPAEGDVANNMPCLMEATLVANAAARLIAFLYASSKASFDCIFMEDKHSPPYDIREDAKNFASIIELGVPMHYDEQQARDTLKDSIEEHKRRMN